MLFGLGAQRLTLDKLGIQYLHSRSRSDKQFRTLRSAEALTFSDSGSDSGIASVASLFCCLPRFRFRCYPPHRNIHYTTILVHRTENGSHLKVILRLDVSYLIQTNQASVGHFACAKQWRNKGCTAQSRKLEPKTQNKTQNKQTNGAHFKTRCFRPE